MGIFSGNPVTTKDDDTSKLFPLVPQDVAQESMKTLRGLQSGEIFAPSEARANEALARTTQQMRATAGSQFGPALGQGAAVRAQQGLEQSILGQVGDTQLAFAEKRVAGQQAAMTFVQQLSDSAFTRQMKGVDLLIQQGGAANYAAASKALGEMFPDTDFDFSRALQADRIEDFTTGMNTLAGMLASGFTSDVAMQTAIAQNISQAMGMSPAALSSIYTNMMREANPILAAVDALSYVAEQMNWDPDTLQQVRQGYLADLTGMDMEYDAGTDSWHAVPFDGYRKVTNLSNLQAADMINLQQGAYTEGGAYVPPGRYHVAVDHIGSDRYNSVSGDTTTTVRHVYALLNEKNETVAVVRVETDNLGVTSSHMGFADITQSVMDEQTPLI